MERNQFLLPRRPLDIRHRAGRHVAHSVSHRRRRTSRRVQNPQRLGAGRIARTRSTSDRPIVQFLPPVESPPNPEIGRHAIPLHWTGALVDDLPSRGRVPMFLRSTARPPSLVGALDSKDLVAGGQSRGLRGWTGPAVREPSCRRRNRWERPEQIPVPDSHSYSHLPTERDRERAGPRNDEG
jgi:hypothetical protein